MKKYIITFSIGLVLIACNNTQKQAEEAYAQALSHYEMQDYFAAKNQIDTIRAKFPKEYDILKQSLMLMRQVEMKESERTLAYCDSLIPVREAELVEMKKSFNLEKNEEYETMGHYVWKQQTVERNVERCYIRCGVNEIGEMYLASVYYGKGALKHTSIKANIPKTELSAETIAVPYDGGMNYRFEDNGMTTEVVTYKEDKAKSVIQLIFDNAKERVRIEYTGGRPYIIYMAEADKKSVSETYRLAMVLSDLEKVKTEREKALKKIDYLKSKGV